MKWYIKELHFEVPARRASYISKLRVDARQQNGEAGLWCQLRRSQPIVEIFS